MFPIQTQASPLLHIFGKKSLLKARHRAAERVMELAGKPRMAAQLRAECLILADLDEVLDINPRFSAEDLYNSYAPGWS